MPKPEWVGFIMPARLLTVAEVSLLSPLCDKCNMTAVVVEAQAPLKNKRAAAQALIEFGNADLIFYCGYHAPLEVPEVLSDEADLEFYHHINRTVSCSRYAHRRYASNCVHYNPRCLKRCASIKQLLGGIPPGIAQERVQRGRVLYRVEKERKKEDSDT